MQIDRRPTASRAPDTVDMATFYHNSRVLIFLSLLITTHTVAFPCRTRSKACLRSPGVTVTTVGRNGREDNRRASHCNRAGRESRLRLAFDTEQPPKEVIVVGGGWAGFGAASHLSGCGVKVTLLEAQSSAGGLAAGWETAKGKKVEVGIHGFWRSYRNIDRLISEELKLDNRRIFTPYVRSALYTKDGLSVVAPLLGDLPRLPAPLGPALYPQFSRLGLLDRASALGLTQAFLDFDGSDEAWERYDKITARELFRQAGVSTRLYEDFLEPMLLVLPMCPGEDCSAAAALSCFQYFALEHQGDFDVRWLRGNASELIFAPWAMSIEEQGGRILGGKRVSNISFAQAKVTPDKANNANIAIANADRSDGELGDIAQVGTAGAVSGEGGAAVSVRTTDGDVFEADAVVLAVGITAAKFLVRSSSQLSSLPQMRGLANLRGVDVVAARLFFSERLDMPRAASVAGGSMAPGLEATGLTFYHLNDLQDAYRDQEASVVEVDLYHANTLLPLTDEEVMRTALAALNMAVSELRLDSDMLEDYAVVRAAQGVSHFFPGAFQHLPDIQPSEDIPQLFMAGDWVARGGHRSWSQEKALVEGRRAAAAVCKQLEVREGYYPAVIAVEADEPHIALGRAAVKVLRNRLPNQTKTGFSR